MIILMGKFQESNGLQVLSTCLSWWFGTCVFLYIGNNHSNRLSYFHRGRVQPPIIFIDYPQIIYIYLQMIHILTIDVQYLQIFHVHRLSIGYLQINHIQTIDFHLYSLKFAPTCGWGLRHREAGASPAEIIRRTGPGTRCWGPWGL